MSAEAGDGNWPTPPWQWEVVKTQVKRSRANQPCVETVFVGTLVPENERDVFTHAPSQAPRRAHVRALSTRPRRGVRQALSYECRKFLGFEKDSSRSCAK